MEELSKLDETLFIWLNGFHTEWMDSVMSVITHRLTWIPFYVVLLIYLYKHIEQKKLVIIASIIVTVGLADFITSGLMKPFFMRLRPCHNPELSALIHVAGHCGGKFGFASSHAANTFSLFGALLFWLGWKNNWTKFTFVWAITVAYSRIYVGVHYPADILMGMAVGFLIAIFIQQITSRTLNHYQ
jgi:undecaprenyl-diphosphatase